MNWILLLIAGLFEVSWAIGLKYTEGLSKFWPTFFTLISLLVSILLLGIAVRNLPVGTAYAVWTGIGAIGTAILGIILFGESVELARLISLTLIIFGILGLKLSTH